MSSASKFITPEEYLELDNQSEFRNEYVEGEIFAMAKASKNHRSLVLNLTHHLRIHLAGSSCRVDGQECRVFVSARTVYLYPDVLVTCGEEQYLGESDDTLLNPLLVIEVLSPSTEDYDHGKKFAYYRSLPSFREYLLVAQDRVSVEHFYYQEPGVWTFREYLQRSSEIEFKSIPAALSLQSIYENIIV
jgi:Uma2 family endonuclease